MFTLRKTRWAGGWPYKVETFVVIFTLDQYVLTGGGGGSIILSCVTYPGAPSYGGVRT